MTISTRKNGRRYIGFKTQVRTTYLLNPNRNGEKKLPTLKYISSGNT